MLQFWYSDMQWDIHMKDVALFVYQIIPELRDESSVLISCQSEGYSVKIVCSVLQITDTYA